MTSLNIHLLPHPCPSGYTNKSFSSNPVNYIINELTGREPPAQATAPLSMHFTPLVQDVSSSLHPFAFTLISHKTAHQAGYQQRKNPRCFFVPPFIRGHREGFYLLSFQSHPDLPYKWGSFRIKSRGRSPEKDREARKRKYLKT